MEAETLFTVLEIARDLRVSEGSVYKAIRLGQLEARRLGRTVRIERTCRDKWVESLSSLKVAAPDPAVLQPALPALPAVILPPGSVVTHPKVEAPAKALPKAPAIFHLPIIDLLVLRHPGMIAWLRRHGVQVPAFQGLARRSDLVGRSVLGSLPLELAVHAGRLFMIRIPSGSNKDWASLTADDLDVLKAFVVEVTFELSDPIYPD